MCKIEGKRLKLYSQEKHQSSFLSFSVFGNVIKHLHSNYFVATNGMICMGYRYSAGEEGYERYFKAKNRYLIGNKLSTSIRTHADSDLRWVRANEIEKVVEEPRHHLNVLTLAYHQQPAHS